MNGDEELDTLKRARDVLTDAKRRIAAKLVDIGPASREIPVLANEVVALQSAIDALDRTLREAVPAVEGLPGGEGLDVL